MGCCHADFAQVEESDRGFTLGMPTFTFGAGVLAEAGDNAVDLGLKRVALFTDRKLLAGEHVAKVMASLASAHVEAIIYDEVAIEPTDASLQQAARFAREANVDGYVSVGGGSVMDTCKAANLYATHPADFMTYVNAPIGGGQRVPGPVKPHIACPTTSGTGSEATGIAIDEPRCSCHSFWYRKTCRSSCICAGHRRLHTVRTSSIVRVGPRRPNRSKQGTEQG